MSERQPQPSQDFEIPPELEGARSDLYKEDESTLTVDFHEGELRVANKLEDASDLGKRVARRADGRFISHNAFPSYEGDEPTEDEPPVLPQPVDTSGNEPSEQDPSNDPLTLPKPPREAPDEIGPLPEPPKKKRRAMAVPRPPEPMSPQEQDPSDVPLVLPQPPTRPRSAEPVPTPAVGPDYTRPENVPPNAPEGPRTPEAKEAWDNLQSARTEYAKLTAERRSVSTFGKKNKLEAARDDYHAAVMKLHQANLKELVDAGFDVDIEVDQKALEAGMIGITAASEAISLTLQIEAERVALAEGKRFNKFYQWWANQGGQKLFSKAGFVGRLKKAGAMGAIGLVPGIAAGVAGAALLGPVVGGALAAAAARGVARGLAGAKINKEAGASTITEEQAVYEHADITEAISDEEFASIEDLTGVTEARTAQEVSRNRRRLGKSAVIGALSGAAGAIAGGFIAGKIGGGGAAPTPEVGKYFTPKAEAITPEAFQDIINPGDGLTQTIVDYAGMHGVQLEPQRSFEIFNNLKAQGLINAENVTGSTPMDVVGNIGYEAPGYSVWNEEIIAEVNRQLGIKT